MDGRRVLVYSCCVRARGDVHGQPIGVLGIVFNWDELAQVIVENTPLSPAKKAVTRICIVDDTGLILADTQGRQLQEWLQIPGWSQLATNKKGFAQTEIAGVPCCIGYVTSPGFETYGTGWHSLIIQRV